MKHKLYLVSSSIIGGVILLTINFAYADTKITTFDEVLSIALKQSPSIKQIEQSIASYKAESKDLSLFDNPQVSVEVRPYSAHSSGLDVEHEISLSQPLRLSNFGARQHISELINQTADIESKMLLVSFEQNILLSYGRVWALQERARYLAKLIKRADTLLAKVQSASVGGLIPISTQKLIQAEQKRLKVERNGILAELEKAFATLIKLVGAPIQQTQFAQLRLNNIPAEIEEDNQIPLMQRIKAKTVLAIEQDNLAKLDSFPQFTPRVSFDHTADGDDRFIVGLSFSLPLFDRNQPEQMRANAEKNSQRAIQKYVDDGVLQKEIELFALSAKATMAQAEELKRDVIPTIEEAYSAAEHEVFSGQGSPLQLWQVLTEMRDLQERYLELWVQSLSNRTELSILTGKSFS